jgi:large subunit ribosomal protein L2
MTPALRLRCCPTIRDHAAEPSQIATERRKKPAVATTGHVSSRWIGGGQAARLGWWISAEQGRHSGAGRHHRYDPMRSARIALNYFDGERRHRGAGWSSGVGMCFSPGRRRDQRTVIAFRQEHSARQRTTSRWPRPPLVVVIAGSYCQLMAKDGDYAQMRLPSGEVRSFHVNCRAVVGQVGNIEHENVSIGKAGRNRWKGRNPSVRGVAMNPVDHPMGGGEGKSSGGRHPTTPWGKITKGLKTRRNKLSDRLIVRRRKK